MLALVRLRILSAAKLRSTWRFGVFVMTVIGVAPQTKFFAVKVLSAATGSGSFAGILQGIVYAADNGADVINMSLGAPEFSQSVFDAVQDEPALRASLPLGADLADTDVLAPHLAATVSALQAALVAKLRPPRFAGVVAKILE